MQLNQTVHLLHFTITVMTCNSTAMSPCLVYLTNTSLEDTYHIPENNAIVQMATCQFLTDCQYGRRNTMDSALFVYLKCQYLLLHSHNLFTLDKQTYDLYVDNLYHSACQATKYMNPIGKANIWQLHPSGNICQIHWLREHCLWSRQQCQIQMLTLNLLITNLKSKSSYGFTLLILLKCIH